MPAPRYSSIFGEANDADDKMTKDMKAAMKSAMQQHYQQIVAEMISASSVLSALPPGIAALDKRPWWKKFLSRARNEVYWATLGRFRSWLHRDCGEY